MLNRNDVLALYSELDKYQSLLASQEPYWRKCSPCINKGQCCIDSDTSIFSSEYEIIKDHIKGLPENLKNILVDNVNREVKCPFRTEGGCIIHDVRPLTCRITPYSAGLHKGVNGKIEYMMIIMNP